MTAGSIIHHPVTRETAPLVRGQIRKLQDRRREVVREFDEEIRRLQKMLSDAGEGI